MNMTNQEQRKEERGVPGWLELYDLSLHSDVEARTPLGAYILGIVDLQNNSFKPSGETIDGNAIERPSDIGGTPGWVELSNLQFYGDMVARTPIPPYVHGFMDRDNHFYPDGKTIVVSSFPL